MALIDTAEMYGEGRAENWWARRSPAGATRSFWSARCCRRTPAGRGTVAACERSLRRLGTDRLDLYLLHWRGSVPLAETFEAFEALQAGRQDPAFRRQQFRPGRHAGAVVGSPAAASSPTRCSTTFAPRHRVGAAPRLAVPGADHGLFADRAGQAAGQPRACRFCTAARHDAGPGRPGLAVVQGRRNRHTQDPSNWLKLGLEFMRIAGRSAYVAVLLFPPLMIVLLIANRSNPVWLANYRHWVTP